MLAVSYNFSWNFFGGLLCLISSRSPDCFRTGETRGNLAAGGRGVPIPLTDRDREIAATVAPMLLEKGLDFVGLDVIGRYLTEINVTSPTCAREIDAHQHSLPDAPAADANGYRRGIADDYFDALERKLANR